MAAGAVLFAPSLLHAGWLGHKPLERRIVPCGPGAKYVPKIHAAFVRRKGDYGILWPGAIYDGEAARREYSAQVAAAEGQLGLQIRLRPEPIYSAEEAGTWLAQAKADKPDGFAKTSSTASRATPWPGACSNGKRPTPSLWIASAPWGGPGLACRVSRGPECWTRASPRPVKPTWARS